VSLEELRQKSDDTLIQEKANWEQRKAKNDTSAPANIALIDHVLAERALAKSEQAASRSELMMWISVVAAAISAIATAIPLLK